MQSEWVWRPRGRALIYAKESKRNQRSKMPSFKLARRSLSREAECLLLARQDGEGSLESFEYLVRAVGSAMQGIHNRNGWSKQITYDPYGLARAYLIHYIWGISPKDACELIGGTTKEKNYSYVWVNSKYPDIENATVKPWEAQIKDSIR